MHARPGSASENAPLHWNVVPVAHERSLRCPCTEKESGPGITTAGKALVPKPSDWSAAASSGCADYKCAGARRCDAMLRKNTQRR